MRLSEGIRSLPQDIDLQELFLSETTRRVAKDGTLSMQGRRFEAGVNFIGQKVSVRFDPRDMRRILIVGRGGESAAAFPVDLEGNTRVKRDLEDPKAEPRRNMPLESLDRLAREIESRDEDDDVQGVLA